MVRAWGGVLPPHHLPVKGGGVLPCPYDFGFYARVRAGARDRGAISLGRETQPPGLSSVSPGGSDINAPLPCLVVRRDVSLLKPECLTRLRA